MLQLQPYMDQWRDLGLDVILISGDRPDRLEKFLAERGLDLHIVLDRNYDVHRLYRIPGFPTTVLIDREGNLRYQSVGWSGKHFSSLLQAVGTVL